ncbi:hypothetical protein [Halobacterium salinarum]|nr:hypothetical protein [Halobacterium salinarum]MDL0133579.1 hypothetical protein [Halobacterium salinarum]
MTDDEIPDEAAIAYSAFLRTGDSRHLRACVQLDQGGVDVA